MPSRYEELGSVLIEAMRAGLPVVASRTGGIPDLVAEGETGLLVPPGDPTALALALDRIPSDPRRGARMRANARQRAELYRWEALAERVRSAYDGVRIRSTCGGATDGSPQALPRLGAGLRHGRSAAVTRWDEIVRVLRCGGSGGSRPS